MKKIKNSSVNQKDRIVCVTVTGTHKFYYQSSKSGVQLYLFEKKSSPSIFSFFKDYGVRLNGLGYSLTLKQIYEYRRMYRNHKIKEVFERLPGMIEYVLREYNKQKEQDNCKDIIENADEFIYDDRELAA